MNGEDILFNLKDLVGEENNIKDKKFLCKKHLIKKDIVVDDFEDGLNISGIENNEDIEFKKNTKINNHISIDEDFSEDLDHFNDNKSESNIKDISLESIQIHFDNKNNNNHNNAKQPIYKKRITKEDLDNVPLPVFDCIYCTNEKVVFNNFINNILSDKYLFLTSIYDINDLNYLILSYPLFDKKERKETNEKLKNIIAKSTEYVKQFIVKDQRENYYKSDEFKKLCENYIFESKRKLNKYDLIHKNKYYKDKDLNKISKYSINNKYFYNSTNSLTGLECDTKNIVSYNIKNNYTIFMGFNSSININFNMFSLNSNTNNQNKFDDVFGDNNNIEKNESLNNNTDKDEIMEILNIESIRKISTNDIKWDNKYYDIWNPEISSDYEEDSQQDNDYELIEYKNVNIKKDNNYIDNSNKNIFTLAKRKLLFYVYKKDQDRNNVGLGIDYINASNKKYKNLHKNINNYQGIGKYVNRTKKNVLNRKLKHSIPYTKIKNSYNANEIKEFIIKN